MKLTRYKLGDLIEIYNKSCGISDLSIYDVSGINREKEFFEPSKQVGNNTSKYKEVPINHFACNLMHVGRDRLLPISFNPSNRTKYVSPAYIVFRIIDNSKILNEYFFMMLKSDEKDRFFWFFTDSSIREAMSLSDFMSIELLLPPLEIQEKYVAIYNAMVKNQQGYEKGLEDLKLVCDAFFDNIKKDRSCYNELGKYIKRNKKKNKLSTFNKTSVKGFNNEGNFIEPMRLFSGDISTFKIVSKKDFVYNSRINSNIEKLSVAYNENKELLVSPTYESFYIYKEEQLYPYYLYMILQRNNFSREVLFNSFGSSTLVFGIEDLKQVKIPIPDIKIQQSIADIYKVYKKRKEINEKLKTQINDICKILIRGSIEEAKR